ncbi:MAG TPA: cytochrome c nitrite reductase small subunit [Bellilinea sp.]|nr:cytochrome c nitrite reductase small subunit [Bellilinea sp.]
MKTAAIVGIICVLIVLGVGIWATDFPTYMGIQPDTCNNCHVMDTQYEGWIHGPHATAATCTDCHLPHNNFFYKYYYKAKSGMRDVIHFSFGWIPDEFHALDDTKEIVQKNCIRCHSETVAAIADGAMDSGRNCSACHRSAYHGVPGLSSTVHQDSGLYPLPEIAHEEKLP